MNLYIIKHGKVFYQDRDENGKLIPFTCPDCKTPEQYIDLISSESRDTFDEYQSVTRYDHIGKFKCRSCDCVFKIVKEEKI